MSIGKRAGFRTLTVHGQQYRWRSRNEGWNGPLRAVVLLESDPSRQVIFDARLWEPAGSPGIPVHANFVGWVSRALVTSLIHLARSRGWPDVHRTVRIALDARGSLLVIQPRPAPEPGPAPTLAPAPAIIPEAIDEGVQAPDPGS